MRKPPVWYIHIDRGIIDANRKHRRADPPVTVRKGKHGKSFKALEIELPAGARVTYTPEVETPILPCGARVVIASPECPTVIR